MRARWIASLVLSAAVVLAAGCTGGQETSADTFEAEKEAQEAPTVDAKARIAELGTEIPVYGGARYREDFTRRDAVMLRNQYGDNTEVLTLSTDDALPKVWHYYVTYLAQYRAWEPLPPYPPDRKDWRTFEVDLSQAMQDPFVPGTNLKSTDQRVILQVAETEAEPPTVIRYIITPKVAGQEVAPATAPGG